MIEIDTLSKTNWKIVGRDCNIIRGFTWKNMCLYQPENKIMMKLYSDSYHHEHRLIFYYPVEKETGCIGEYDSSYNYDTTKATTLFLDLTKQELTTVEESRVNLWNSVVERIDDSFLINRGEVFEQINKSIALEYRINKEQLDKLFKDS